MRLADRQGEFVLKCKRVGVDFSGLSAKCQHGRGSTILRRDVFPVSSRGSFGSNLSRRLQSDGAPLLGPEHRQVGQALDAEPARKPTLHRGFRQSGGHERKGQRHSDRALAFALADGERLDGLGGIVATPSRSTHRESAPVHSPFFTFGRIGRNSRALMSPSKRRLAPLMMETIMTDTNSTTQQPQSPSKAAQSSGGARGRSAWLRPLALVGLLLGGVALGAGGYAATAATDGVAWREDMRLAFVQRAVSRALDGVGASAAQEAKI